MPGQVQRRAGRYLTPAERPAACSRARSGRLHLPHPEIRQATLQLPGCGMALEPVEATLEDRPTQSSDMTRQLWISGAFALPWWRSTWADTLSISARCCRTAAGLIRLVLATPVAVRLAVPGARRAVGHPAEPQHVHPDAWHGPPALTWSPPWRRSVPLRCAAARHAGLFRARAVIVVLVLVARCWNCGRDATSGAIKARWAGAAHRVARRQHSADEEVAIRRSGWRPLARGRAKRCRSTAQSAKEAAGRQSTITGEPMPVTKQAGAKVIGGTLSITAALSS